MKPEMDVIIKELFESPLFEAVLIVHEWEIRGGVAWNVECLMEDWDTIIHML